MRKTLAIATSALLLAGGTQLPAAAAAPDAPTDLQIGWSDPLHMQMKISWADHGEANIIRVEYDNGVVITKRKVKAGDPNEYVRVGQGLVEPDWIARISVVSVDEAGIESVAATSPWFDSSRPAVPTFTLAQPLEDGSLKLEWKFSDVPEVTPNDPLDRPRDEEMVRVGVNEGFGGTDTLTLVLPAGTTTAVIPPQPHPYHVDVLARNEWDLSRHLVGAPGATNVMFKKATVALKVPAAAEYSSSVSFAAVAGVGTCPDPGKACSLGSNPLVSDAGVQPELQIRADAGRPWMTVARYPGRPADFKETFRVTGGGEYRLYVPAWSHELGWTLSIGKAASTSPRRIAVQAKFVAAGFNTSTAAVSQPVKATVSIQPATTGTADLQWYDGTRWRHSSYISLVNGKGTTTFKAAGRGTTHSWRVVTPALTYNGLPIVATSSQAFKLTVR
jgi:hypothetical protein